MPRWLDLQNSSPGRASGGNYDKIYSNPAAMDHTVRTSPLRGDVRENRLSTLAVRASELGTSTMRTPRPNEEYITALRKGTHVFKYGRRGKPHAVHLKVSEDLTSLMWTSRKAKPPRDRKEIPMTAVEAVEAGQGTNVFKRFPSHAHLKSCSFSVLYKKRGKLRSLDIVCSTPEEYELWFTGLHSLHSGLIKLPLPKKKAAKKSVLKSAAAPNPMAGEGKLSSAQYFAKTSGPGSSGKAPAAARHTKDFIGDVYIWGAPSGAVSSGRSAEGATSDGLQQAWVPTLVNDTFRLDVGYVACGPRHAAMITKNGETYTWGSGDAGRLGHGDCQPSSSPKMVLELSGRGVVQLACGDWHTAAITRDGSLYTWGDGTAGILGHGTPHRQWSPKRVERPLQGVIFTCVATGPYHTAAVSKTGDLYTWGDGFGGKLGHRGHDTCLQPRKVEKLAGRRVTSVACGVWHTVCLTLEENKAEAGLDSEASSGAALGAPQFSKESTPATSGGIEPAPSGTPMAAVPSSRRKRGTRLKDRGVVWVWGGGDRGCLGVGDEEGRMEPEEIVGGPESVRQIAAGLHFTVMLSVGGKVWMCGSTVASGFDGKTVPAWEGSLTPMRVKGPLAGLIATHVSAGMQHVAVIAGPLDDPMSQLFTWGSGTEGQLGHGAALPASSPSLPEPCLVKHLEGRRFVQVACGGCNTMAVVEHDPDANRKHYETVTKELDDLLPKKTTGPPPGLLVGPSTAFGPRVSSSINSMDGAMSGSGRLFEPRRSRPGSIIGDVAHSIASLAQKRGPDSEAGGAHSLQSGRHARGSTSVWAPLLSANTPPTVFLCPITKEVFEDPVVAADGYTYERSAIVKWLRSSIISPMSGLPMDHMSLTPSHTLRSAIEEWRAGLRREGPASSRHRYAPSLGGSSQGSISGYLLPNGSGPFTHSASGFQGAMIVSNPVAAESNRSTPNTSAGEPLLSIGERL